MLNEKLADAISDRMVRDAIAIAEEELSKKGKQLTERDRVMIKVGAAAMLPAISQYFRLFLKED